MAVISWCCLVIVLVASFQPVHVDGFEEDNSVTPLKSCNDIYDWSFANCGMLARNGYCKLSARRMKDWCPKSCGYCQRNAPAPVQCKVTKFGCCEDQVTPAKGPNREGCPEMCFDEKNLDCIRFAKAGYCATHFDGMRRRCPKSCNLCRRGSEGVCFNVLGDGRCKKLYRYGMCTSKGIQKTMYKYCRKACGQCPSHVPKLADVVPKCASEGGCCWDKKTPTSKGCPLCSDVQSSVFCKRFKPECYALDKISSVQMRMLCPKTCGICNVNLKCENDIVYGTYCRYWKKAGLCKTKPMLVGLFCRKTCGFC